MKILVAYDGTLRSQDALVHGVKSAKKEQGEVVVLSIFPDELFIDYDGGPHAKEMASREHSLLIEAAKGLVKEEGAEVPVTFIEADGNMVKEIVNYAADKKVDTILSSLDYKELVKRFPIFQISAFGFLSVNAHY